MKVALIHDALPEYGGAEKVLEELHLLFPDAPVFTSVFAPERFPASWRDWDIRTTWLNRIPFARRFRRAFFMINPFVMSAIDLDAFDVVISSSYNFAHHVVAGPETRHICYCHSPPRFLWDAHKYAEQERLPAPVRLIHNLLLAPLRALDRSAAVGVETFVSTSRLVQKRITAFYGRSSVVVPPPIDLDEFHVAAERPRPGYYLMMMRLVGWKRPDIVVEAFNRLGLPLVIAGDGRELGALRALAGPNIRFVGRVDGAEKARLLAECEAFILPANEDFGITPLEAMASGRPVIAYRKGGALDTVIPGITGEFFDWQTPASVADAVERLQPGRFDPAALRIRAERYARHNFQREILRLLSQPGTVDAGETLAPQLRTAAAGQI